MSKYDPLIKGPLTPRGVCYLLEEIMEQVWGDRNVEFTQEWPRQDVSRSTVVWKIYRRVGGRDGVEVYKPRYRGMFDNPEDPTVASEQYAQWHTIIYQFDIFAISNQEVDKLVEDFEDFLFQVVPTLKDFGVNEFLFDEETAEEELGRQDSQEIYKRTLRYRCILERKFVKTVPLVQEIWLRKLSNRHFIENELVNRSSLTARDLLSNGWVRGVTYISDKQSQNYAASGDYIETIDFRISIQAKDGKSYIEWLPNGKHPAPGTQYYVSYFSMGPEPREAVSLVTPPLI